MIPCFFERVKERMICVYVWQCDFKANIRLKALPGLLNFTGNKIIFLACE